MPLTTNASRFVPSPSVGDAKSSLVLFGPLHIGKVAALLSLRAAPQRPDFSVEHLAELIGLTPAQVTSFESGHHSLEPRGSVDGWFGYQTLTLADAEVLVGRVPITQLEYDNLFSTANLYQFLHRRPGATH